MNTVGVVALVDRLVNIPSYGLCSLFGVFYFTCFQGNRVPFWESHWSCRSQTLFTQSSTTRYFFFFLVVNSKNCLCNPHYFLVESLPRSDVPTPPVSSHASGVVGHEHNVPTRVSEFNNCLAGGVIGTYEFVYLALL
jgi:hypothetical protein